MDGGPRPRTKRSAVVSRRKAYEVLRRVFMSPLTEVVEARPLRKGAVLRVRARCSLCGYAVGSITVVGIAGSAGSGSGRVSGRPHDETILASLARHLRSAHDPGRALEVVDGGGEMPWISARLTKYRCRLCGEERTGFMSALVHVIEHARWGWRPAAGPSLGASRRCDRGGGERGA